MFSKSSRGRPKPTSEGRPLDVRLRRPWDVISRRPQDVRLGRPRDRQTGSLVDILKTLVGVFSGHTGDQYLLAGLLQITYVGQLPHETYNTHTMN